MHPIICRAQRAQARSSRPPFAMGLEHGAAEPHSDCTRTTAGFQDCIYRRPFDAYPVLVDCEKDRELVGEVDVESAGGITGLARDAVRIGAVIAVRIEDPGGGLDQRAPRLIWLPMPLRFAFRPRLRMRCDSAPLPGDAADIGAVAGVHLLSSRRCERPRGSVAGGRFFEERLDRCEKLFRLFEEWAMAAAEKRDRVIREAADRLFTARERDDRIARGPSEQNRTIDLRADSRLIGGRSAEAKPRLLPNRGAFCRRVDNAGALLARRRSA